MKLLKSHIENFGKLSNFDYSFQEELNTIKENNGFGKTTFASFIKAMFYGLDAKRNTKSLIDRKKYEPWQGGVFGGYIIFEINGKEYKLERIFAKKEADDIFKLYDLSTNLESTDFSENIGEEIFKLNKEAYERSTYISGQNMETAMNDSINAKLGNILESENDVNTSEKALKALEDAIKFYKKTGGRGEINEKILEKSNLEKKLEICKINEVNLQEQKKTLEIIKKEILEKNELQEKYRKELKNITEEEAKKAKFEHYKLLKNGLDESQNKLKEAENINNKNTELIEKIELNKNKLENTENKIKKIEKDINKNKKICLTSLILAIIIAIIAVVLYFKQLQTVGIILAFVCLAVSSIFIAYSVIIAKSRKKKELKEQEKENLETMQNTLNSILEKEQGEKQTELNKLKQEYNTKIKNLEEFEKQNDLDDIIYYKPTNNIANKIEIEKGLTNLNNEISKLNDEKYNLQNKIEYLEASVDTFEIENQIDELLCKISQMQENVVVLEKTKDFLSKAKENFSSRYLKKMQESFINNLEILNGTKLNAILDVNLNAEVTENGLNKKLEYFSTGYQDLIYLSMRLSLIDSLFEGEKPFIILDDPFVNLDEGKIESAINLLKNISKKYQVIYFTCHNSRI